jgi:hypothetical protein
MGQRKSQNQQLDVHFADTVFWVGISGRNEMGEHNGVGSHFPDEHEPTPFSVRRQESVLRARIRELSNFSHGSGSIEGVQQQGAATRNRFAALALEVRL